MRIADIKIVERVRKEFGDIESLARSMEKLGQLQPIGVGTDNVLIYGERRLRAAQNLGWTEIEAKVVDCDALQAERDENEIRKDFTVTERLAIAQRIAEGMQGRVGGNRMPDHSGNISLMVDQGQTRDLAAKAAGFGSGKTFEAAAKVVAQGTPELVAAMDEGKVSIHAAAELATLPKPEQSRVDFNDKHDVKKARAKVKPKTRINLIIEYEEVGQGAEDVARALWDRDPDLAEAVMEALINLQHEKA